MNKIGLILTTFNKLNLTKEALKSLYKNTKYPFDLVIVDCMSNDGTREWARENNLDLITFDKWVSVSTSLNAGIRHFFNKEDCDLEINYDIGWIHNDMEFYEGWLSALVKYLNEHQKCGRVNSHNMRDPLAPERAGNELPFLIRGHIFKTIGGFDERFKGACGKDDWDFNNKLLDNGWTVMITPESKVYHKGAATRSGMCPPEWEAHNSHLYWHKWGTNDPKC